LAYLDGLISGRLQQDTESRTSLPFEVLVVIKQAFWLEATRLAECQAWVLFGPASHLSGEIDMDDSRAQTFRCIAGLKCKQRQLQGQAKGCYQCHFSETCHCEGRRPHKRCYHSNRYEHLYEAMIDVMHCLPGLCRHKACHRCQVGQLQASTFRSVALSNDASGLADVTALPASFPDPYQPCIAKLHRSQWA
jgi:hypothetical protein